MWIHDSLYDGFFEHVFAVVIDGKLEVKMFNTWHIFAAYSMY